MDLKVWIVSGQPGNSAIIKDGNHGALMTVKELPPGLGGRMKDLLHLLRNIRITEIQYVEKGGRSVLLVKKGESYCTPDVIQQPNARDFFEETIALLVWHFSEHFSVNGCSDGCVCCLDCERTQQPPIDLEKCQNWMCSSHQKKSVIDPAYVPTTAREDPETARIREWNELVAHAQLAHIH